MASMTSNYGLVKLPSGLLIEVEQVNESHTGYDRGMFGYVGFSSYWRVAKEGKEDENKLTAEDRDFLNDWLGDGSVHPI